MKLRSVLACGVLTLALVGCGDDDEGAPDAAPSSPVASSSSPSDEPSPTFDPTKETAKEFIRRWIRLGNEMQQTGETEPYLAITTGKCRSCNQFADRIDSIYESGGWVRTRGERATSITQDRDEQWTVEVQTFPTKYKESQTAQVQSYPGGEATYVVYIARDESGSWILADALQESS